MPMHSHHFGRGRGPRVYVPWYFWVKHRTLWPIITMSILTLILVITDIILCFARYGLEIGNLNYFIFELDILVLVCQLPNFLSCFYPEWMFCGWWMQFTLCFVSLVIALGCKLPLALIINSRSRISTAYVNSKINNAFDLMAMGLIIWFIEFMSFIIWNSCTQRVAVCDPEFIRYQVQKTVSIMQSAGIQVTGLNNNAAQQAQLSLMQLQQNQILTEQIRQMQMQLDELRNTQQNTSTIGNDGTPFKSNYYIKKINFKVNVIFK